MADTRTLVTRVNRIDPPVQKPLKNFLASVQEPPSVHFESGETARLDPAHRHAHLYADVLEDARNAAIPVYVEIDAATSAISELLIPIDGVMKHIGYDGAGNAEIEIDMSHAIHILRKDSKDFDRLVGIAKDALANHKRVAITERPGAGIIDIRPIADDEGGKAATAAAPFDLAAKAAPPISPERAQDLFNLVAMKSCAPTDPHAPCIPFMYPDDGCWGRAHEMCRLMIIAQAEPNKVWIYGKLSVGTPDSLKCFVRWVWHVAPTVEVQTGNGVETWVIDPALFQGPVPQAKWKSVQGDPAAQLAASAASAFTRDSEGHISTDPNYVGTNKVLAMFRAQLKIRTDLDGPPPYAQCEGAAA